MKKNVWNRIKLFALAGAMSLALLGCGGTGGTKEGDPVQEEQSEDLNSKDKETPANGEEQPESPEENIEPEKQADNTGAQDEEEPLGEITELGNGQFTIKKFYQETLEDGSQLVGSPAEGAEDEGDMEFGSLTVLCDENTHIYQRTIRDGGANYEDSESSFEKLKKGMQVSLEGSYEGDVFHATEVQIVEVII